MAGGKAGGRGRDSCSRSKFCVLRVALLLVVEWLSQFGSEDRDMGGFSSGQIEKELALGAVDPLIDGDRLGTCNQAKHSPRGRSATVSDFLLLFVG